MSRTTLKIIRSAKWCGRCSVLTSYCNVKVPLASFYVSFCSAVAMILSDGLTLNWKECGEEGVGDSEKLAYTRTVCEHETLRMNCLTGKSIQIVDAFYGRNTEDICDDEPNKPSNLNCHSSPHTIAEVGKRCNHREMCSVAASNAVFTDPCLGIYKYLRVSYKCLPETLRLVTACDGDSVNVFCPGGDFIKVNSATYGKTEPTICNRQGIRTNTLTCQADSERVTQIAVERCDGKSSCAIHTINDVVAVVGDPCFGIVKHLDVNFKCL